MENENFDVDKIVEHWLLSSDRDFDTMTHLFKSKDYHWALFMGHLVIEKLLKASIVKSTRNHSPLSHDLRRLAKLSEIEFDDQDKKWLDTITSFNINARYESYKQEFYKKCTPVYTDLWIKNIITLRKWIKTRL